MTSPALSRRLLAEFLGTALLVTAVVGSGIGSGAAMMLPEELLTGDGTPSPTNALAARLFELL